MTMGVFGTSQAFWPFKKANKVEIKNEQYENNSTAGIMSIKGGTDAAKLLINKEGTGYSVLVGGAVVKSKTTDTLTAEILFLRSA